MINLMTSDAMSRTTLDLDASVLDELRRRGAREGKSKGDLASELLAQSLKDEHAVNAAPLKWISRDLGVPRIDLQDKEVLYSVLDDSS
jgi:plasmid stability protein